MHTRCKPALPTRKGDVLGRADGYGPYFVEALAAVVVPWGVGLSALTALLLAVTGWYGGELSYRHMVGVDPLPELVEARETTLE